jgi:hypothetical protein
LLWPESLLYWPREPGGEDDDQEGGEPRTRRRPAFGARTSRKGRQRDPLGRKLAALNRLSVVGARLRVGRPAIQLRKSWSESRSPNHSFEWGRRGGNRSGPDHPSGIGPHRNDHSGKYSESIAFPPAPVGPTPTTWIGPMANNLPFDRQVEIIATLTEGVSIRATERLTDIHRDTIMRLSVRVGRVRGTPLREPGLQETPSASPHPSLSPLRGEAAKPPPAGLNVDCTWGPSRSGPSCRAELSPGRAARARREPAFPSSPATH